METIKKLKDVIHHVGVWFEANTLPGAKKKYIARPEVLPGLDISEVAAKASLYGETVNPEEMIRNVESYCNLCAYLVADGYEIKNPLFHTRISVPGAYDGHETALPPGLLPTPRMNASPAFRRYIGEHVNIHFKGIDETCGHMFTFLNEATGKDDELTPGGLFRIHGTGLKILHDNQPSHIAAVGLRFIPANGQAPPLRATTFAVNEPRTLVVLIPPNLPEDDYFIEIVTQSPVKHGGTKLKIPRTVRSEQAFTCISQ
ncbi:MAG: DUF4469 domain-containing protein [Tannerella sp.]|jgi:hypothetical protein|nr:DUF4469 domain-containing protein [Tannerella sp.]